MNISQVSIIEVGDEMLRASFILEEGSKNLQTADFPRTASVQDVESLIQQAVDKFVEKRADDNVASLKDAFQDKEFSIDGGQMITISIKGIPIEAKPLGEILNG